MASPASCLLLLSTLAPAAVLPSLARHPITPPTPAGRAPAPSACSFDPPAAAVQSLDVPRLLRLFDSDPKRALLPLARQLNASTPLARYWLHHHGRRLPPSQQGKAEVDAAMLASLRRRPSLGSLARRHALSRGAVQQRLRALLTPPAYERLFSSAARASRAAAAASEEVYLVLPSAEWSLGPTAAATGVSRSALAKILREQRLRHLVLARGHTGHRLYADEDFLLAMRRVAAALTPRRHGTLSLADYERARRKTRKAEGAAGRAMPSPSRIIQRYGSWNAACRAAGLAMARDPRVKQSGFGQQQYDRTALLAAVAGYVAYAEAEASQATVRGYEEWAQRHARPSIGTIRNRLLRDQTWAELISSIRAAATEASSELTAWLSEG